MDEAGPSGDARAGEARRSHAPALRAGARRGRARRPGGRPPPGRGGRGHRAAARGRVHAHPARRRRHAPHADVGRAHPAPPALRPRPPRLHGPADLLRAARRPRRRRHLRAGPGRGAAQPQGGHAGQGRPVGDVAAQAQRGLARRRPVHRRRRDLQLGVRDRSRHRRGHPRGLRRHHADREDRLAHREARLQEAAALLGLRVHRRRAAPAPPLRAGEGRGRPRGDRHAARGRHRALPARGVPAGRLHPRGDQQELPRAEPAVLRPARDQVRRRRGGGGPRGAADRRVRLRLLRAGGGGGPAADRAGRQGPRARHPEQRGELHPVQPDGSRGARWTASARASRPRTRC